MVRIRPHHGGARGPGGGLGGSTEVSGALTRLLKAGGSGVAAQITAWMKAHFTAKTVGGATVCDLTGR